MTAPRNQNSDFDPIPDEVAARPAGGMSTTTKYLLIGLGVLTLLGGGYYLMQRGQDTAVNPEPTPAVAQPAPGTTTPNTAPEANAAPGSDTSSPSSSDSTGEVDTPVAPPLTEDAEGSEATGQTDSVEAAPAAPTGINPDQPLIALSKNNPFRPNQIESKDVIGSGTGSTSSSDTTGPSAVTPVPATVEAGPITVAEPKSSDSEVAAALAPERITLPGTSSSTTSSDGARSANTASTSAETPTNTASSTNTSRPTTTLSVPKISLDKSNTVSNATVAKEPSKSSSSVTNKPSTSLTSPKPSANKSSTVSNTSSSKRPTNTGFPGSNTTDTATPVEAAPALPPSPPVVGMTVPKVNTVPGVALGSQNNAPAAANQNQSQAVSPVVVPKTPAVVTELGLDSSSQPETGNAGSASAGSPTSLDAAIKDHQVAFDAAVLGPVNTAIFRTDKGFVVVAAGQPIPNTDIVVKEVTSNTVKIALGTQTKTLELEKR